MILGSFINVCIYRIPEKKSIVTPPSSCRNCGRGIKWHDNIPVLSYMILGGKCRYCGEPISMQYPMVEMFTGFLVALLFIKLGPTFDMFFITLAAVILIIIAGIDLRTMLIPNGTVLTLLVLGVVYSGIRVLFPGVTAFPLKWFEPLIGFVAASLPLFLVAVISKGGMGGGDIKLMAAAGVLLGWKGAFVAMLAGSVAGAVISLFLIILRIKGRKDMIPFGPFLCAGILFAALFTPGTVNWYLGLFGM
jgi:leader peptidase (prepilin peptidase)/N-methyltransferase